MSVFKDERFKHIVSDPKFRKVPRKERKIPIDKRFQSMFTDKKFQIKYSVDKRGRPIRHSNVEDYRNFYDLSSDEDSETDPHEKEQKQEKFGKKTTKNDNRQLKEENISECDNNSSKNHLKELSDHEKNNDDLFTDQHKDSDDERSSVENQDQQQSETKTEKKERISKKKILEEAFATQDEIEKSKITQEVKEKLEDLSVDYARGFGHLETDSSSDEVSSEESEEEIEHNWGELDKDADVTDDATKRIAICNMDWDRVNASDLMVLFNSFTPSSGYIESVTVYPSEFGLSRMKEEDFKGPLELTARTIDSSDEDEDGALNTEKLREYQLKRLKYYYAVVMFDSPETANKVYTECDGMEYESSSAKLDMRFIPDDMTFDQEPREVCDSLPDVTKYRPRLFVNTALQQGNVKLTWDETDPKRKDITKRIAAGDIIDTELHDIIATSSEEESENENSNDESVETESKMSSADKYRSLLLDLQEQEEKKKDRGVEMEISWGVGSSKPQNDKKHVDSELTPFEKFVEKRRQKIKERHQHKKKDGDSLFSDDELPPDVDLEDPYFKAEINSQKKKKNKKYNKETEIDEETIQRNKELELLVADEPEEEGKKHFSLKKIQDIETASKKKKKQKKIEDEEDNFKIDLKDERFEALFTSHLYNVDPTDSHFRKTKAMDEIFNEKSKRRRQENYLDYDASMMSTSKKRNDGENPEISRLIESVKRKVKNKN